MAQINSAWLIFAFLLSTLLTLASIYIGWRNLARKVNIPQPPAQTVPYTMDMSFLRLLPTQAQVSALEMRISSIEEGISDLHASDRSLMETQNHFTDALSLHDKELENLNREMEKVVAIKTQLQTLADSTEVKLKAVEAYIQYDYLTRLVDDAIAFSENQAQVRKKAGNKAMMLSSTAKLELALDWACAHLQGRATGFNPSKDEISRLIEARLSKGKVGVA